MTIRRQKTEIKSVRGASRSRQRLADMIAQG